MTKSVSKNKIDCSVFIIIIVYNYYYYYIYYFTNEKPIRCGALEILIYSHDTDTTVLATDASNDQRYMHNILTNSQWEGKNVATDNNNCSFTSVHNIA